MWAGATEEGRSEVDDDLSARDLEEEVAGDEGSAERGGDDGAVEARERAGEDSREGEEGDDDGDDEAAAGEAREGEAARGTGAASPCEEVGSEGEAGDEGSTCSSTTVATTTEESGSTDRRFLERGGVTSDDEAAVESAREVAATSATCSSSSSSWRRLREGPLGEGGVDGAETTARKGEGVLGRDGDGMGEVASVVGAERTKERRAARLYGAALSRALLNLGGIAEERCAIEQ